MLFWPRAERLQACQRADFVVSGYGAPAFLSGEAGFSSFSAVTRIGLPPRPGQAGKSQAQAFVRLLVGYSVTTRCETGDKVTRFGPFSAQAPAGNVLVVRGPWNEPYFTALEGFPDAEHDDADATAGAFEMLTPKGGMRTLHYYERRLGVR